MYTVCATVLYPFVLGECRKIESKCQCAVHIMTSMLHACFNTERNEKVGFIHRNIFLNATLYSNPTFVDYCNYAVSVEGHCI